MPRPRRCRRICREPEYVLFEPDGIAAAETVTLTLDEYEAIRLMDREKKTHEQCAALMDISRTTVTEIYERARAKIADCLVTGKRLAIAGGDIRLCDGSAVCRNPRCGACASPIEKEEHLMRIAVTYENGNVFQHFGHTAHFAFYDVEGGEIKGSSVVPTLGSGHGALAGFLKNSRVDVLICGGIGGGAQMALKEAGIQLYGGVQGSCDAAVKALISGELSYDPNARCDHHDHEHGHGEHQCGEHGCGSHSCHH